MSERSSAVSFASLDEAEADALLKPQLTPAATQASLDVREIVYSGLAYIAPLKFLVLGPLSVGVIALLSHTYPSWDQAPIVSTRVAGSDMPIGIPQNMLARVAAPDTQPAREHLEGQRRPALGIPSLSSTMRAPLIENDRLEAQLLQITPPTLALEDSARIPSAPKLLSAQ